MSPSRINSNYSTLQPLYKALTDPQQKAGRQKIKQWYKNNWVHISFDAESFDQIKVRQLRLGHSSL